jgi:hypothetical protein
MYCIYNSKKNQVKIWSTLEETKKDKSNYE